MRTSQHQMRTDTYGPWLVAGGFVAALSQPLLGLLGTAGGLVCAVVLAVRGHRVPAGAVVAVTGLVLFAFLLFVSVAGATLDGELVEVVP